jgi:hypothetical protein
MAAIVGSDCIELKQATQFNAAQPVTEGPAGHNSTCYTSYANALLYNGMFV